MARRPRQLGVENGSHQIGAFVGITEGQGGDVQGDEVLVGRLALRSVWPHEVGDLELVGNEVAVGVADVGPVQPDVTLLCEAVEPEPSPSALRHRFHLEPVAVQHRALLGEPVVGHPGARDRHLGPGAVVERRFVERAP